jgi:hypothetical protein
METNYFVDYVLALELSEDGTASEAKESLPQSLPREKY